MHIVEEAPKLAKIVVAIFFDESNIEGLKFPHNDPLVIILVKGNNQVK